MIDMENNHYRAAIYCRLSKDDELQGESASISNQRSMLEQYCKSEGWDVIAVYQDDGYTGLNMDRPDLKRMLKACEQKLVNLVITKDLSRLGRNYLEVGRLTEDFFPRNGVRYIAMNDGIDTGRDNNDIAPFKNILNEMYSKDISKKVHSSYYLKATQGKFTGPVAPIGYLKDPEDKNHLLIDEETAPIIREIFSYARNGHGPGYICKRLEEKKIPCPTWWNRERGIRNHYTKWELDDPENGRYVWDFTVVKDILRNPVYIGSVASQKFDYKFKIGVIGEKKADQWIVVEDCHDAIIDHNTFLLAQQHMSSRQRPRKNGEFSLFAGLIKCGECGKALTIKKSAPKAPKDVYTCKTYNSMGKGHCTQHRIEYDTLYDIVLKKIRECASIALSDPDVILNMISDGREEELEQEHAVITRAVEQDEERLSVLDKLIMKLYEDMVAERISDKNFQVLLSKAQSEQDTLHKRIKENSSRLQTYTSAENDVQKWLETIREYADLQMLDSQILHTLIKEIIVHEEVDGPGNRYHTERKISVEIHFNLKPTPELIKIQ